MALSDILLLGDPRLTETCTPVEKGEMNELLPVIQKLGDLVLEFRATYGAGRAIAAPQIGVMKRLVVLNIDQPVAMINPVLFDQSEEMMELWDDCMSFPNLLFRPSGRMLFLTHASAPEPHAGDTIVTYSPPRQKSAEEVAAKKAAKTAKKAQAS